MKQANQTTSTAVAGYYWCDQCDEPAFGDHCRKCRASARFIPNTVQMVSNDHRHAAEEPARPAPDRERVRANAGALFDFGRKLRLN